METKQTTTTKVEATTTNEVVMHELKDDLRIFTIVEMKRNERDEQTEKESSTSKFHVALGNQLITNGFDTKREAIQYLKSKPYQVFVAIMTKYYKTMKDNETEFK